MRPMRAIRIARRGGPEVLTWTDDAAEPACGPDEVLVEVEAVGLNRADLLQCMGLYPAPPGTPPDIPGLEYAGRVVAVGTRARRFQPGARVMGIVSGGAFSERLAVHEREAIAIPDGIETSQAAAIPEAFATAYDALVLQGGLRSGETVLIHAAASGVGTAALQLVKVLGARALGTSRSPEKLARCQALGLLVPDDAIAVGGEPASFVQPVLERTSRRGAELALELAGGAYLPHTLQAMATAGRVLLVGLLAGTRATVDLSLLLMRRLSLVGSVLRSRPLEARIELAQALERHVVPLFTQGQLRPVVDSVYAAPEVSVALGRLADNATFGKVVLQLK